MRKIVDGRIYDTDTATIICGCSPEGFHSGDFQYEVTRLYKTKKGAYFIAGHGGPLSRWRVKEGQSGWRSGEGLELVTEEEARHMCEVHGTPEDFTENFGEPEEG